MLAYQGEGFRPLEIPPVRRHPPAPRRGVVRGDEDGTHDDLVTALGLAVLEEPVIVDRTAERRVIVA